MKTPQRGHRFLTVATILFVVSLLPRLAIAQEKAPLPLLPGRDGDAIYQEAGVGETGTIFVNPPAGAR